MAARRAIDVLWFLVAAAQGGTVGYLFAEHGGGHNETFAACLGILVVSAGIVMLATAALVERRSQAKQPVLDE